MLRQRLIVAAVGLPLLALLILAPEPVFAGGVELVLAIAAYEIARAARPSPSFALSAAAGASMIPALARAASWFPLPAFLVTATVVVALLLRPGGRLAQSAGGWWLAALLYPGAFGAHLVLLRTSEDGQAWVLLLLAATFATDTGAYAVGRLIGRRPFWPAVSPKKTWEGAFGGLAAGAAATLGTAALLDLSGAAILVAAALLPIAAIAGDLIESALKRRLDVKDMSSLLPGHGGIFDRLDSILATGACLYWIVRWIS